MKTAQKILMIIAGAVSIGMTLLWFILSMVFFIGAGNAEFINDYVAEHPDLDAEIVKSVLVMLGVIFCIIAIMALINCIVSFKGKNTNSKGLLIANIIFGVLSGVEVNIVGAIFGLIARNQSPKTE